MVLKAEVVEAPTNDEDISPDSSKTKQSQKSYFCTSLNQASQQKAT